MTASVIDGRALAATLREKVASAVAHLGHQYGRRACLATVLVGDDPASQVYVRSKIKACNEVGIASRPVYLSASVSGEELALVLDELNADPSVNGILLQLPLPDGKDSRPFLSRIDPTKDVDGLSPYSQGLLMHGEKARIGTGFAPCTPSGIVRLIHSVRRDLAGLHAVVIGRSLLVGRPVAELLLQQECAVTVVHRQIPDSRVFTRQADILVVAAGVPHLVEADWVKRGAIVVDVGINRNEEGRLVGDVDFEVVKEVASAMTPVPGGVGPMTIASLLVNTTIAAYRQNHLAEPEDLMDG